MVLILLFCFMTSSPSGFGKECICEAGILDHIGAPEAGEIDQNQPQSGSDIANCSQNDLAQSFKQTNGNACGAGVYLTGYGFSVNLTIQLWDALPNAGGTMLSQGTTICSSGEWADVFWTPVMTDPAQTYYLVFEGHSSLTICGSENNPYPYGHVFANSGYNPYPGLDFAFRTWYEPSVSLQRCT